MYKKDVDSLYEYIMQPEVKKTKKKNRKRKEKLDEPESEEAIAKTKPNSSGSSNEAT